MQSKRVILGLGAAALLAAVQFTPAHAANPTASVSYDVGVCDPKFPLRCIKPNLDGSINANTGAATSVATTDKSGSIAAGGVAQAAIALNASRKGWCIQNPSSATAEGIAAAESLWIRVNGTAAPNVGTEITPGNQVCNATGLIDPAAISVYAVTISHKYNGFEVQ